MVIDTQQNADETRKRKPTNRQTDKTWSVHGFPIEGVSALRRNWKMELLICYMSTLYIWPTRIPWYVCYCRCGAGLKPAFGDTHYLIVVPFADLVCLLSEIRVGLYLILGLLELSA